MKKISFNSIIEQILIYCLLVVFVTGLITLLNYTNALLQETFTVLPLFAVSLISAIVIVTFARLGWHYVRESDTVKNEFITAVTHKFRAPITHIKWASESIVKNELSDDLRAQIEYIQHANTKLVEMTNLIVNASETERGDSDYRIEENDLSTLAREISRSQDDFIAAKHITLATEISPDVKTKFDADRIKFVMQTFFENAIHYTPKGGTITVSVFKRDAEVFYTVRDTGIGIDPDELTLLFSKFYRTPRAKEADPDGMGIGLFISKKIITRHEGRIWADSEGANKGSTLSFALGVK
jgi:signal transduction histidine kinase